jgi:hypothetical protein
MYALPLLHAGSLPRCLRCHVGHDVRGRNCSSGLGAAPAHVRCMARVRHVTVVLLCVDLRSNSSRWRSCRTSRSLFWVTRLTSARPLPSRSSATVWASLTSRPVQPLRYQPKASFCLRVFARSHTLVCMHTLAATVCLHAPPCTGACMLARL